MKQILRDYYILLDILIHVIRDISTYNINLNNCIIKNKDLYKHLFKND